MTRLLYTLLLVTVVAISAAACKNSDNTLRDPNSKADPSTNLPTNAE